MAFLLAEMSSVAIAAKPELYLLIIGMVIILRFAYKQHQSFMSQLNLQDERGEQRADKIKEIVDASHAHSIAMMDKLTDHCSESNRMTTEAITRCSRAVESSEKMISQCVRVLEERT